MPANSGRALLPEGPDHNLSGCQRGHGRVQHDSRAGRDALCGASHRAGAQHCAHPPGDPHPQIPRRREPRGAEGLFPMNHAAPHETICAECAATGSFFPVPPFPAIVQRRLPSCCLRSPTHPPAPSGGGRIPAVPGSRLRRRRRFGTAAAGGTAGRGCVGSTWGEHGALGAVHTNGCEGMAV